ncbi:hypothetical protein [Parerythrobacter lacustris]|uniref:YcxB family protein n=1 Tax=Parerythrobacter lacustris TaxID=2969984 RepID=A0ABT1XQZ9_9SPHN|nr:hypothetical protein [Parerythrobacter lacustris]MCR2834100.1 hypothetical protein [Parerythrobacter lacustris]
MTEYESAALPPPLKVVLRHTEVMAAAIASNSRAGGSNVWFGLLLFALLFAAIWLGHLVAFWFAQQLSFDAMFALGRYLPVAIPAALGLFAVYLALAIEQRRREHAYRRSLAAVGAPLEREGVYEVTEEALVLTTERMLLAPRWPAIDTLERGDAGWVLSADQLHFLIPYADFPSVDTQRPLLAAITARMTPEARARSRDAVEFAESGDAPAVNSVTASQQAAANQFLPSPAAAVPMASGWLTQEQAGWAASVIQHRIAGSGFHGWAYPLTGAVAGMLLALMLVGLIGSAMPAENFLDHPLLAATAALAIPLVGGALGLAFANRRLGVVVGKAWRQGLAERGVPDQIEAQWALTESGLSYRTARFTGEAVYASIHQLVHEHGYLIAAADALTLCIPDTAFASPEDAKAFADTLLERMPEAARARSSAAAS